MSRPVGRVSDGEGAPRAGLGFASWRVLALGLLVSTLAPALEAQQPGARVHGAQVRIIQHQGPDLRGELLALEDQRIWVLEGENAWRSVLLGDIRMVRVQRHEWTPGRLALWTGVAGGLTSAGLFVACLSISEAGGCATFSLIWAALWAGVGGVSALLIRPSESISPAAPGALRAYARFPQGLPEGYPPLEADLSAPPEQS